MGYYGFCNSGDEVVFKLILIVLEEESYRFGVNIELIVFFIDLELMIFMYGVCFVYCMKLKEVCEVIKESDGLISGGGSLL